MAPKPKNAIYDNVMIKQQLGEGGSFKWECKYCGSTFNGSATRIRAHLIAQKGKGIKSCEKVPEEVKNAIAAQFVMEESNGKKRKKRKLDVCNQLALTGETTSAKKNSAGDAQFLFNEDISFLQQVPTIVPNYPVLVFNEAFQEPHENPGDAILQIHSVGAEGTSSQEVVGQSGLRRKGRLKEQDKLIEFMLELHETHLCEEAMLKFEKWVMEHMRDPARSKLKRLVPTIGKFFTPLPVVQAFKEYDKFTALSRRIFVPPNFAELRHILNIAQIHASVENLKLVTFDAEGTLYDGSEPNMMCEHNAMAPIILQLLNNNVYVAIFAGGGYPGNSQKYDECLKGLIQLFQEKKTPESVTSKLYVFGGECNYLLRYSTVEGCMEFVDDTLWQTQEMQSWAEGDQITNLLSEAELALKENSSRLSLDVNIVRKDRAVGAIPSEPVLYEVLEDLVIGVQNTLVSQPVPFCAFNNGTHVFVDVGNKSIGIEALITHLGLIPQEVLHVGDRFTRSGSDMSVRDCCCILWVAGIQETIFFVQLLLRGVRKKRLTPYIE
eukprot:TRINITY_DN14113_c0_g2_i3.p1 TRINITY_DN14113_c0_g2~~TRINITY_DN14113_c0_g2_i3.p1  ORF type:complete len:550 (-),score=115.46 TRINITY_DN14113_c0_g2_i3:1005-2654(-)